MSDALCTYHHKIQVLADKLTNPSYFEFPPPSDTAEMEKDLRKEELTHMFLENIFSFF